MCIGMAHQAEGRAEGRAEANTIRPYGEWSWGGGQQFHDIEVQEMCSAIDGCRTKRMTPM